MTELAAEARYWDAVIRDVVDGRWTDPETGKTKRDRTRIKGGITDSRWVGCLKGDKFHAGDNVGCGKDYTLYAKAEGKVQFRVKGRHNRTFVSVVS